MREKTRVNGCERVKKDEGRRCKQKKAGTRWMTEREGEAVPTEEKTMRL